MQLNQQLDRLLCFDMSAIQFSCNITLHLDILSRIPANKTVGLFESAAERAGELGGCAMDNGTKKKRDHGTMDNRTVDHGTTDNGTVGQWRRANRPRGQCTLGQWDFGKS